MNIRAIYEELSKAKDLKPSPRITKLFALLDEIVLSKPQLDIDLNASETGRLQKMYSRGEYEFESFWAKRIIKATNPKEMLSNFPYFINYISLINVEWLSFKQCTSHNHHSVIFCGGGPLPMTAIVLALTHNISSTVIDNDKIAVSLAKNVIKVLGLEHMIDIRLADALSFSDFKKYNTIFVAALVGLTEEAKEAVFRNIKLKSVKGTHIIARSSYENRKILYCPLPQKTYEEFTLVCEILPNDKFVNSVVIFKKDE